MIRLPSVYLLIFSILIPNSARSDDDYWRAFGGPLGGDVRCFALDPVVPNRVYLGLGSHAARGDYAEGGGLFYSTDYGESWIRGTLQGVKIGGIVKAHGILWVSTYGDGVFVAPNPRDEWMSANDGLDDLMTRCIVSTPERIILGTDTGPFYTNPVERQWMPGSIDTEREFWNLAIAPWNTNFILAATDSAVWRSVDGGQNWSFSGNGIDQLAVRSVAVGEDGLCWAGSFDDWNDPAKLYCSADTGLTWTENYVLPGGTGEAVWTILPSETYLLIGTGWLGSGYAHIHRSTDGGAEWDHVYQNHYRSIRALCAIPSQPGRVLAGCESTGGVLCSEDDGVTWTYRLTGLDAGNVYEINVLDEEQGTVAAGVGFSGAFSVTDDLGAAWTRMDSLFPSLFIRGLVVIPNETRRVLAAAWNGIYGTDDLGETWTRLISLSQFIDIDFSPLDLDVIYAGGNNGFIVSRDGGYVWEDPDSVISHGVNSVAVDPRDGWRALVGTNQYLFETRDAAFTWDTLEVSWPRSIAFHPFDSRKIYVGTADGVFISNDNGETFNEKSEGLPGEYVNEIISDPENPDVIWAGTPVGVYKTMTGGDIWFESNRGLGNLDVRAFMIHNESRRIFVGSHSGGIRFAYLEGADGDDTGFKTERPSILRLAAGPVPCADHLSVAVCIHGASRISPAVPVDIALYSLNGNQLRSGKCDTHEPLIWNVAQIPAGAYVLRASSAGVHAEAPVVVIR